MAAHTVNYVKKLNSTVNQNLLERPNIHTRSLFSFSDKDTGK